MVTAGFDAGSGDVGAVILVDITYNNTTYFRTLDSITEDGSSVPAGKTIVFTVSTTVNHINMLDSFCNKFYWERTS